MQLQQAKSIADELVAALSAACERIEIAGGIRRGKPEPHDIEIVCIPKSDRPRLELGRPEKSSRTLLDAALWQLERQGRITGRVKDGDKYKQLRLREGISLDLFVVTCATWGVQFTIRTGPGSTDNNFSRWIVTQRSAGGALPSNLCIQGGNVRYIEDDQLVATPEERDFFQVLGLDWIKPAARVAQWGTLPDLIYTGKPAEQKQEPASARLLIPADDIPALLAGLPAEARASFDGLGPGIRVQHIELNGTRTG